MKNKLLQIYINFIIILFIFIFFRCKGSISKNDSNHSDTAYVSGKKGIVFLYPTDHEIEEQKNKKDDGFFDDSNKYQTFITEKLKADLVDFTIVNKSIIKLRDINETINKDSINDRWAVIVFNEIKISVLTSNNFLNDYNKIVWNFMKSKP